MSGKTGVVRGKWGMSPMREAATLLGVLKQSGLAGRGLVQAFEFWSKRVIGYSREDLNSMYLRQTGRDMTDYIMTQKADRVVRYKELGPEAEVVRKTLAKLRG
jgi:hypothetical protein